VRIQRGDDRLTVFRARVVSDTLVGQLSRSATLVAAPLAEIERAETLKLDKERTAVTVGVVVGVLAIVVATALSNMELGLGPTWSAR
jgi:hypothetical protein